MMSRRSYLIDAPMRLSLLRERFKKQFSMRSITLSSDSEINQIIVELKKKRHEKLNKPEDFIHTWKDRIHIESLHIIYWYYGKKLGTYEARANEFMKQIYTLYPHCYFYNDEPVPRPLMDDSRLRTPEVALTVLEIHQNHFIVDGSLNSRLKLCLLLEQLDRHSRHFTTIDRTTFLLFPRGTFTTVDLFQWLVSMPGQTNKHTKKEGDGFELTVPAWLPMTTFLTMAENIVVYIPKWYLLEDRDSSLHVSTLCPEAEMDKSRHTFKHCPHYKGVMGEVYT
jgi:hypothetical protein